MPSRLAMYTIRADEPGVAAERESRSVKPVLVGKSWDVERVLSNSAATDPNRLGTLFVILDTRCSTGPVKTIPTKQFQRAGLGTRNSGVVC